MSVLYPKTPPMGWNSFDCFGSDVTEDEIRKNAEFIATNLKQYGWEYVVVDFCWSHPTPGPCANPHQMPGFQPLLHTDDQGRLVPSPERFPSSAAGKGFKPLADYIHSLGLKFGIHLMRGIPRQVVDEHFPTISAKKWDAEDVVNTRSTCPWLNHMYGIDMNRPDAQDYYNFLFELYAEWDVDYVKVDDMIASGDMDDPGPYHGKEVEGYSRAIENCGRDMVLSLSPGPAPIYQAKHLSDYATMWRISSDFWDDWSKINKQFDLCRDWAIAREPKGYPDADMLPIGRLSKRGPKGPERDSYFTKDESYTLMSLWAIFQSPLMMGGNLVELDEFTKELMTNKGMLEVNKNAKNGRELFRKDGLVAWKAEGLEGKTYIGLFNRSEIDGSVELSAEDLGIASDCKFDEAWTGEELSFPNSITIPAHGAMLLLSK